MGRPHLQHYFLPKYVTTGKSRTDQVTSKPSEECQELTLKSAEETHLSLFVVTEFILKQKVRKAD